mmetsp:Transcript_40307/g.93422  ORF Transcript_40307/g.93422 Transcript_40307/m.93422 type:complete len:742 (+) Transcript_40307:56-2281(+)
MRLGRLLAFSVVVHWPTAWRPSNPDATLLRCSRSAFCGCGSAVVRTGHLKVRGAKRAICRRAAPSAIDNYLDSVGVDSFGLGILVGVFGTVSTITAVLFIFVRNLRGDDFDGNTLASSGGFVMPNFFFQGARDIFSNVRNDAAVSTERFKETGRFAEIYTGIQQSQEIAMLRSIDAIREQFPQGATREILFGMLRRAAMSSSQLSSALYDFALRLQAKEPTRDQVEIDILSELWSLDEGRCVVSARRAGEGGRRPWINADADILLDEQVPALRTTLAECAKRPLFARVAPEILARPTFLALVRVFDVFQPSEGESSTCGPYSPTEFAAIDEFLEQVTRTSVMRRAFRHITKTLPVVLTRPWKEVLFKLWFQRRDGKPCVFEHVFLGNLTEDISGQPVAGGFHCWLKFYLEEVRGTARYLGYIYNNAEAGLMNSRYVSGKFVWDYSGYKLVKDQGGFFIGTSPEWQLAAGTAAYFETSSLNFARQNGWVPWTNAYAFNEGYTKETTLDGERYRHVLCRAGYSTETDDLVEDSGHLITSYSIYLGPAFLDDASGPDHICSSAELVQVLPRWLLEEGIVLRADSALSQECVRFCVARGCRSVRESLSKLREALVFDLEDAVGAARTPGYPRITALVEDTIEVVPVLLQYAEAPGPLSAKLPSLLTDLRTQGRRGPRLHQPLRLLLTGRAEGAPIAELLQLLDLAQTEGGDEAGVRLADRIALIRETFSNLPLSHVQAGAVAFVN